MTALSDEQCQIVVDALRANNGVKAQAARSLGMSVETYKSRISTAARRGFLGPVNVLPGFNITQTSTTTNENGEVVRTSVQQKPERPSTFQLPDGFGITGISTYVDADQRVVGQWVKASRERTDITIDAIKEALADLPAAPLTPPPKDCDGALLQLYPIADQHNGLMSWGRETGENYDLKIGASRLRKCATDLVSRAPAAETALILNLGDWQHADDSKNETPAHKHKLDVDGRYFKVTQTGVNLMADCIDLALQKHNRVKVRNLPGNHDPHAHVALTLALEQRYRDETRVEIIADPGEWFFMRFGMTLIGAHHGHKCKPADMAMNMAVRNPEDWGKSKYRVFYFGHIHHETAKEVGNVRCESFQTLAAKDAYSHGAGYNSGNSLTSITFHHERGEIGRHRVNIPPVEGYNG